MVTTIQRALSQLVLGLLMVLVLASPALAEIGCIADDSLHLEVEGPLAFSETGDSAQGDRPQREPVGHSAACHLSHANHSQLPAAERSSPPVERLPATRYWVALTAAIHGSEPEGTIRPPRA